MRHVIALHKALADETRVRILRVLQELGELCVCDVECGLDITQSRASRHLTILRQAGLVSDRREGQWVYFRIAEPMGRGAKSALAELRIATADETRVTRDIERTKQVRRSPCRDE
ncbi:MAG: metalloregulator ArsR/SmtB family transcription factor [Myxococcota bacterium]